MTNPFLQRKSSYINTAICTKIVSSENVLILIVLKIELSTRQPFYLSGDITYYIVA